MYGTIGGTCPCKVTGTISVPLYPGGGFGGGLGRVGTGEGEDSGIVLS